MFDRIVASNDGEIAVEVDPGETVSPRADVWVLETMPIENDVVAQTGGTVTTVPRSDGAWVDVGETTVTFE